MIFSPAAILVTVAIVIHQTCADSPFRKLSSTKSPKSSSSDKFDLDCDPDDFPDIFDVSEICPSSSSSSSSKTSKSSSSSSSYNGFDDAEDEADAREESDYSELYASIFLDYYANWHCFQESCDGNEFSPPKDNNPGMNFNGLGQGVCLLQQFHCDLCPSKELACSCDGNTMQNEDSLDNCGTQKCTFNLDPTVQRTALIEYCENLLGMEYLVGADCVRRELREEAMEGRELGTDCNVNFAVEGCSRYIAAEGYACCPFDEDHCLVHQLKCERNRDKSGFAGDCPTPAP